MSKTKEALLKEQDNLMEYYIGFHEWLDSLNNDLNEKDIDAIQEEHETKFSSPSFNKTIVSKYIPANNKDYRPNKGEML